MPLPAALTKIRIGGDLRSFAAGRTGGGRARIRVTTPIYAAGENVILTPEQPISATITAGLFLTDEFVSPTAAGISPQGVPLLVEIRTDTYNDEWYVEIPEGATGTLNLADLPRASTAPQVFTYALATQLADYIAKALVDAKGDLIVATADGTVTRLPAGSNGQILAADSSAATGLKWQSGSGAVLSVNGFTGAVVLVKGDIGLGNVDNTSDAGKPVSTATQNALNAKVNLSLVDAAGDLLVGSGADALARLAKGSNTQVLTVVDGTLAWATPALGLQTEPSAARYGCKALTMHPHDVSWISPQYIALTSGRHYMYWVPLPVGTLVSGVRLPVQAAGAGAGELHFGVYQDDNSQLGASGNVAAQFTGAVGQSWQNVALTAAAVTTGAGVWITALSTLDTGPQVVFSNTDGTNPLAEWLLNPSSHKTAAYRNGVVSLPATLVPGTATSYIDFAIGVT